MQFQELDVVELLEDLHNAPRHNEGGPRMVLPEGSTVTIVSMYDNDACLVEWVPEGEDQSGDLDEYVFGARLSQLKMLVPFGSV